MARSGLWRRLRPLTRIGPRKRPTLWGTPAISSASVSASAVRWNSASLRPRGASISFTYARPPATVTAYVPTSAIVRS